MSKTLIVNVLILQVSYKQCNI